MPWVSSAATASSTTSGNRDDGPRERRLGGSGQRARHVRSPAPAPRRRPCAGSRRSGRGRTGRSRPGSRSTASWPARCRSRSRSLTDREAKNQRAASTPTSASSSSRVMKSPARLRHRDLHAVAHEADPRVEEHLDGVGVVAHRLGGVPDPRDRAVMVGAPDVDQVVEAAAELLGDVADVGGEVGRLAVRADDHPVLVVAEGGRAEPERAVLLVDVAAARAAARPRARPSRPRGATPRSSRRRTGRRGRRGSPRSPRGPVRPPSGRGCPAVSAPAAVASRPDVVGDGRGEVRRRSRRGSRPPGPARRAGAPRSTPRGSGSGRPTSLK